MNEKVQGGFTLVEVLVATFILTTGLLGMASLQTVGLRNVMSANSSGQASQLVYDMIDRMRVNRVNSKQGSGSHYVTIAPSAVYEQFNCADGCSDAELAQNDLYQWNESLNNALVNSKAEISYANPDFIIKVQWDGDHSGELTRDDPRIIVSFLL
ncbi:MAG: type IV pilus modification protein PilV [Methylococcales bacterium]|nr:type IV pilus modification protein PilV [Methylococcales bacterium]